MPDVELILVRQLASYLTLPIFLVGTEGKLLFYNQAAEGLLGRRFDEAGEMPLRELASIFEILDESGERVDPESIPLAVALNEGRPAHGAFRIRGLDGVARRVEGTAFPLEGHGGRHLGAVAIFWEYDE